MFAAFTFPPIDELFRWKDIGFNDTAYAINKTSLLVMVSSAIILVLFIGGSRRMKPGWPLASGQTASHSTCGSTTFCAALEID